jgi:ATP-binding cassette subfamily B protein
VLGFAANYYEIILLESSGQRIIADLKQRAFAHLLSLDLSYFDRQTTGKLVSRIENDANAMKMLFSTVITHVLGNLLMVAGMFAIMAWKYDLRLAAYVVGLCPVILVAAVGFNKLMEPLLVAVRKQVAEVNGLLTEVIQGIATIQIFGRQAHFMNEIRRQSEAKFELEKRTNIAFNSFFNLLFFTQTLAVVLVLWFGGRMVMHGELTVGTLILFMMFIRTFFVPIMFLSSQFNEFQKGLAAAERIFDLLDQTPLLQTPALPASLPAGPYTIEFRHVWFRYGESESDSDWVLRDLNFFCPAGEHWALVGPTGSGKTTIISLLLRFYAPQRGQILLNGVDIATLPLAALRRQIGLVLQDQVFFPGNLLRNLTLGLDLQQTQVQQVMDEIGLDQLVMRLPQGYQTEIAEGARNLSEGERQLLSFGRALLRNPQVLILDEATSHVDPDTERSLQRAMLTLLEGRTALIIAHRLATIEQADRILVLSYGKLVEQGNHRELMAQAGVYAEMRQLQRV